MLVGGGVAASLLAVVPAGADATEWPSKAAGSRCLSRAMILATMGDGVCPGPEGENHISGGVKQIVRVF